MGILVLGLFHFVRILCSFIAFKFADEAQVNQGVIASLFTTGVMFTTLTFWRIYDEKINLKIFTGMIIICAGVACIGIRQNKDIDDQNVDVKPDKTCLYIAIFFAILASVFFTTTTVAMRHYTIKVGLSPTQINIDSFMIQALMSCILWIIM